MEGGGRHKKCQTIAATLLLSAIALSFTCFILHGLTKVVKQEKYFGEAATSEVTKGHILINGKELDFQFEPASESNGLLHNDETQSDLTAMTDGMAEKAVWRHLNFSVHCGDNEMRLMVIGASAAELQLDMGSAHPLPLSQVHGACGYSMKLNALGLVLVVPYYGCNVRQENGRYVLPMSWRETAVTFICTKLPSLEKTPVLKAIETVQQSSEVPSSRHPRSLHRSKRYLKMKISDDPWRPNYKDYPYFHCVYVTPAPATTTTTKAALWKPYVDSHPLHRLFAPQQVHTHDLRGPLNEYKIYKHLAQQLLPQMHERPVSHDALQHLFGKYVISKFQPPVSGKRNELDNQKRWW